MWRVELRITRCAHPKSQLYTTCLTILPPQESSHETAQLPLSRRLEIAASHGDIHAALVGLVGWSRLCLNTESTIVLFQSDALRLLLVNLLTVRPKAEIVYENLVTLLATCLSVSERDGKSSNSASHRQVATAVVDALRGVMALLPPKTEATPSDDVTASVEKTAAYLSRLVLRHRLSLSGVTLESAVSQDVLTIETQLKAAAIKDSAVTGQTIRDSFQRRDIRSDALVLYESRLEKVVQLVHENATQKGEAAEGSTAGGFLAFALDGANVELQVEDSEVEEVKARFAQLEENKTKDLQAVVDRKKANEETLVSLQQEREALEAKLRAVNGQIETVLLEQEQLQSKTTTIENAFASASSRLSEQHERVVSAYTRKERHLQIHDELSKLENSMASLSLTHRDIRSLQDKHAVCVRQQLEGALRYFGSELTCVKFMVSRIHDTQTGVDKLVQEASSYESLGVHAVSNELTEKVAAMRGHLEEDIQCVEALRKRDMEVVAMMERILQGETHRETLEQLDEKLKKEAQRHIDYVRKVHADAERVIATRSSNNGASQEEDC
jgi:hypothetical protein